MNPSPFRFVTVKTFLGSRLATRGPLPSGAERYLSQLERSLPLKSGFHSDLGREYSASAAARGMARSIAKSESTAKGRARRFGSNGSLVEVEVTRPAQSLLWRGRVNAVSSP